MSATDDDVKKDLIEIHLSIDQVNIRLIGIEVIDHEQDMKLAAIKLQIEELHEILRHREKLFMEARDRIANTRRHLADVMRRVNQLGRR